MSDELRRLLAAATPGPWTVHNEDESECGLGRGLYVDGPDGLVAFASSGLPEDAALIVAAVNALPALLDERDALLAALAKEHALLHGPAHASPNGWYATGKYEGCDVCRLLRAALDRLPEDRP